eukprot:SAG22_NODE_3041_length_1998_cov_5.044760_1_plen_139_part_00
MMPAPARRSAARSPPRRCAGRCGAPQAAATGPASPAARRPMTMGGSMGLALQAVLLLACAPAGDSLGPPTPPAEHTYEANWPSLMTRPLPTWYDEAKVGIFVHWGPCECSYDTCFASRPPLQLQSLPPLATAGEDMRH